MSKDIKERIKELENLAKKRFEHEGGFNIASYLTTDEHDELLELEEKLDGKEEKAKEKMSKLKENKKQVVDMDFYRDDNLPIPLIKEAERQCVEIKKGLIAVKTIAGVPATYEFVMIGKTQDDFKRFYRDLATEDGIDLNEVAENLMKQV